GLVGHADASLGALDAEAHGSPGVAARGAAAAVGLERQAHAVLAVRAGTGGHLEAAGQGAKPGEALVEGLARGRATVGRGGRAVDGGQRIPRAIGWRRGVGGGTAGAGSIDPAGADRATRADRSAGRAAGADRSAGAGLAAGRAARRGAAAAGGEEGHEEKLFHARSLSAKCVPVILRAMPASTSCSGGMTL